MKFKYLSLLLLAVGFSAQASDNTVFSCFTKTGKQIAISKVNNDYLYSFGKAGNPELTFKNNILQATQREESFVSVGTGYVQTQLELSNGKHSYIVYTSEAYRDGNSSKSGEDSGVLVLKSGKQVGDVKCNNSREVYRNFDYDLLRK